LAVLEVEKQIPSKGRHSMGIWENVSDVIAKVVGPALADTGKLIRLMALIAVTCLAVAGAALLLMRFMPNKSALTVFGKSGGRQMVFERRSSDYETEYVVVIHPQGWQETGIQVRQGDILRLLAEGSVAIDLQGLVESVNRRIKLEKDARKLAERRHQDVNRLLPERQWNSSEINSIMPGKSWTHPDGYESIRPETSFAARTNNKIMPQARYGALLMAISPTGQTPKSGQAILVGTGRNDAANPCEKDTDGTTCVFHADRDGKVWFIVNDVWDSQDQLFPDKFYIDNIGHFYAKVSVTEAGHK
jgi:hypothetical protein